MARWLATFPSRWQRPLLRIAERRRAAILAPGLGSAHAVT
jgi:hypothetical protein